MEIKKQEVAVLALHWLVDIVKPEGAFGPFFAEMVSKNNVIEQTAAVLNGARLAGIPIFYTRVCFRPGYPDLIANNLLLSLVVEKDALVDGSPGASIISELTPQGGEVIVSHCRLTAFYGTDLKTLLTKHSIKTLILTGVATNVTVEGTAREAINEGYQVITLKDCCTADSDATHQASLSTLQLLSHVATSEEFLDAIK